MNIKNRKGFMRFKDRKINKKNNELIMEQIFSYAPELLIGVEKYKDSNRNFYFLIILGLLLCKFPMFSIPCCILAVAFVIKMFKFIKYKHILSIVKMLGHDLAYKGIYNKGKINEMLSEFQKKFGSDIIEYTYLLKMIKSYEAFVNKLECIIKNTRNKAIEEVQSVTSEIEVKGDKSLDKESVNQYYNNNTNEVLLTYKDENGKIKKVDRAMEFFQNSNKSDNLVVLKSKSKKTNKKVTVYLYKKSSDLENNVL